MKKQRLKLSLNKIKIASITNLSKIRGGETAADCEFMGDQILTFREVTCDVELCTIEITLGCTTSDEENTTTTRPALSRRC